MVAVQELMVLRLILLTRLPVELMDWVAVAEEEEITKLLETKSEEEVDQEL